MYLFNMTDTESSFVEARTMYVTGSVDNTQLVWANILAERVVAIRPQSPILPNGLRC